MIAPVSCRPRQYVFPLLLAHLCPLTGTGIANLQFKPKQQTQSSGVAGDQIL
jgi:hypothetical protein